MNNKEQWIANVLDSANQIAERKPSPFLFQKIKNKIDLQAQLPRPANNQFNYICPRFWCLKNNTFVDPNDLTEVIGEDGKKELVHPTCGKVLPRGEKQVKPGYYVYEFYTPKPGKKDYKKYPGLIPDSHPKDLCVPCCFEKYNTEGRIKENSKCLDKKTKESAPKIAAKIY